MPTQISTSAPPIPIPTPSATKVVLFDDGAPVLEVPLPDVGGGIIKVAGDGGLATPVAGGVILGSTGGGGAVALSDGKNGNVGPDATPGGPKDITGLLFFLFLF